MDPFTQPGSFQNLLHSQQPNTSFSFVTREPSIELSSSDASVFGPQWADDGNEDELVVSDHKERRKWSPTEDLVLISVWLNTSKDPVVGNEQKAIAFWKRIAAYVTSSPKLSALQKREHGHCKQRWGRSTRVWRMRSSLMTTRSSLHSSMRGWSFAMIKNGVDDQSAQSSTSKTGGKLVTEEDNVFDVMKVVLQVVLCLYFINTCEYLRRPMPEDLQRLLDIGEIRGFPGMIGSIDCMHWVWKNCPTAWKGTLNDINVLDRSPVFDDILQGRAPKTTFVQSIPLPQGPKASLFATHQEAVRKDVERAFGVLRARFAIVKNPALLWDKIKIGKIMRACIILHNMIVEDE
uniref:Myb-like domain-containing protein n=1 Tax=Brassica oleracea var. oleracea TaxID=109376 RepID=A0A0D3DUS2_BRAOL